MIRIAAVGEHDRGALETFRRLIAQYQEALPADLRISDLEHELQLLRERYCGPKAALLVAYDGAAAVGCVAVKPLAADPTSAEIKRLYVVPSARGSGAGRALMETAIGFARSHEYARVVLDTERARLSDAYRLYLSLGFAQCEPYEAADYATPTFMELQLAKE